MTCVYSEYLGTSSDKGVEYVGARCPDCKKEIWFPVLARDREKQRTCLGFPPSTVVATLPPNEHDGSGDQTDLFGSAV